jgi:DNA-3-methyladenine glycosylase
MNNKLDLSFYRRQDVEQIANDLLGKVLVTNFDGVKTSGRIVETEAYSYIERGCHAFKGKTNRNAVMFASGGVAYVYLCYGIHHLFNIVTNEEAKADAVLIRALEPLEGIEQMIQRVNSKSDKRLTSGPGKLTKALAIDRTVNGIDLTGSQVWVERNDFEVKRGGITKSKRIGIDYAGRDALLPWRFTLKGNSWVSV